MVMKMGRGYQNGRTAALRRRSDEMTVYNSRNGRFYNVKSVPLFRPIIRKPIIKKKNKWNYW